MVAAAGRGLVGKDRRHDAAVTPVMTPVMTMTQPKLGVVTDAKPNAAAKPARTQDAVRVRANCEGRED